MQRTGHAVLAIDDVRKAFDNVPIDTLSECHREALARVRQRNFSKQDKERTLALVEAVFRGHDRERQRGIDQGAPYSPTGLNVLLDKYHDRVMMAINKDLLWFRYADNLTYLVRSMAEGGQVLKKVGRALEPLGLSLKGEDGVRDLRRGDTAQLLGFSLRWAEPKLQFGIGSAALDQLRQHLGQAHVTLNPGRAAHEVALSWVAAFAPAYEDGDVADVLAICAECGFRESLSLSLLQAQWRTAWERWQICRVKARHGYRDR